MTQNGVYSRADVSLSSPQYKTYTGSRIASKSHLRLSTLLYHHAFKYEISFLSSSSVWAAFMSIFYRARLYMFVSKLCFCGSTLTLLFLLLLYYYYFYSTTTTATTTTKPHQTTHQLFRRSEFFHRESSPPLCQRSK